MVLSLLRRPGRFFVGTGMEGQLFEIDEATKERSEIARLDHGQILCLVPAGPTARSCSAPATPASCTSCEDSYASKGTVTSDVLDAKIVSKWGVAALEGRRPRRDEVTVAVRSGNVAEPDETWSDWSAEQTDGRQGDGRRPDRPLPPVPRDAWQRQTRRTRRSCAASRLRYATTNQAPEVTQAGGAEPRRERPGQPQEAETQVAATDPNEDELTYSLYVRKDGWKNWVLLDEDLEKKEFEWDTTTTPSGVYRVKVVASDRKDNAAGRGADRRARQ